jgi:hypothetical protein
MKINNICHFSCPNLHNENNVQQFIELILLLVDVDVAMVKANSQVVTRGRK